VGLGVETQTYRAYRPGYRHDTIKMLQLGSDGKRLSVHRMRKRRILTSGNGEIERQGLVLTIRQMLRRVIFMASRPRCVWPTTS